MKVLYYEAYGAHADSMFYSVKQSVGAVDGETLRVGDIRSADIALSEGDYDLVVIHHEDNKAIDELKLKHPNIPYAVYSGLVMAERFQDRLKNLTRNRTFGESLIDTFEEKYDYVLDDTIEHLIRLLDKLNHQQ